MPPNVGGVSLIANATSAETCTNSRPGKNVNTKAPVTSQQTVYKWDIRWRNVIVFIWLYVSAIYGLYLTVTVSKWQTFLWGIFLTVIGTIGITAGAHRLWTHRTYKAKLPLKIILAWWQATVYENDIFEWARDHRMHHKYTDTDADPHNASRGFFFSHMGWLLVRKHKDVKEKGKGIYLKDLEDDPVVMFQKEHYTKIMVLSCMIVPTIVPWLFWGESLNVAWHAAACLRYVVNVNGTWLVNSAAHIYGYRPYNRHIQPRENSFVGYLSLGEGWHNYHHTFPWDYKASEFNGYLSNLTTGFIDLMAKIGWAYDLKAASDEIVQKRVARTGDFTKIPGKDDKDNVDREQEQNNLWGWGDEAMSQEEMREIKRLNQLNE